MIKWFLVLSVLAISAVLVIYFAMYHPMPDKTARDPLGKRVEIATPNGGQLVLHQVGHGGQVGREILMFASAGREASDFNELAQALASEGYAVTLFEAPYINGAKPSNETPTLYDLADDAAVYLQTRALPVTVMGHAFGNRLARATAHRHADKVDSVILIAAGGLRPIPDRANTALRKAFDQRLTSRERREAVRYGFFSGDNSIPDYWLRGWHRKTAQLQGAATQAADSAEWWSAGGKPLLVLSGLQDTIAPPKDTIDLLEADLGDQVTAIRIDGAGHAMLPEQPSAILSAIVDWIERL